MGQENPTPEKYELWDKSRGKPEKNKAFNKKKKIKTISQNYTTQVSRLKVSRNMQENR